METGKKRKTAARLAAIQVLYSRDMAEDTTEPMRQVVHILEAYTNQEISEEIAAPDEKMVLVLANGASAMLPKIDDQIRRHLSANWDMERLGAVMRALLRTAVYELTACKDVPVKVVISEYVSLARAFFSESETGFVNGILDKISREIRGEPSNEKIS